MQIIEKNMHFLKTCTVNVMGKMLTGELYCTGTGLVDCPNWVRQHSSGPGYSKLTMSSVNVSLKFQMLISEISLYFLLKKSEKLLQKLFSFSQRKISAYLVIKS